MDISSLNINKGDTKAESVKKTSFLGGIKGLTPLKKDTFEYSKKPETHVFAYDGCYEDAAIREDIRERILSGACLTDDKLQLKQMDDSLAKASQLPSNSKYSPLGRPRTNRSSGKSFYICENLRQMADNNGVRGKCPLYGAKNEHRFRFRLGQIKESGIETIVDLRSEGECSNKAINILDDLGMKYVNFPVEDSAWTRESLEGFADYFAAINNGDFYVGCANGQARTDLGTAINYVFNKEAKNIPEFYYSKGSASRVSIKKNIEQIMELIKKDKSIVEKWGWANYEEFEKAVSKRFKTLVRSIK
ncbi:MAG: hypothetical protein LUE64_03000 [Candidatus Gastranaerophilales bacterium]|nr:hypothetical protein [Candidatus Gastranaerophilales bacterium]